MLAWRSNSRCRWRCSCWRWGLLPGIQAAANPPCCGVELVWKCRVSLTESRGFSEPCCSWSSVGVSSGRDRRCKSAKKSGQCLMPQTVRLGGQAQAEWVALSASETVHISASESVNGKGAEHRISNMVGCTWELAFLVPLKMQTLERKSACVRLKDLPCPVCSADTAVVLGKSCLFKSGNI